MSLECVKYEGKEYRIANEFYPFLLSEIRTWDFDVSDIKEDVFAKHEDRFVAKWLSNHELTSEGRAVLESARIIYKEFYRCINRVPWPKFKIKKWDTGWWQVRMALNDAGLAQDEIKSLKEKHRILGEKILPRIYEYGFIEPDMNECL